MQRIINREPKGLEALYDRYSRLLYSLIFSIVKKKQEAEIILEEIFLQVWEKAPTHDFSKSSVYSWIVTMARYKALDKIHSEKYRNQKQEFGEIEDLDIFSTPQQLEQLDKIRFMEREPFVKAAFAKISIEQQQLIKAVYLQGYSQSQMAEQYNLPLGTVKNRFNEGIRKMQEILKDYLH